MSSSFRQRGTRILHVHKFAHVVGGVETHLNALVEHQRAAGLEVDVFTAEDVEGTGFRARPSGVREAVAGATTLVWSRAAAAAMDARLTAFRPDLVHFHSIYHHLSPSVLTPVVKRSIPAVMTLHDYKLAAPCYMLERDGVTCTACVGRRLPLSAIRFRCIKGSFAASALCAIAQSVHAPLYRAGIESFLVPSAFARDLLARSGALDADRLRITPLGVELPRYAAVPADSRTVVFFGRLSPEKGIRDLLDAWGIADLPQPWRLKVVGDGSLRAELEARRVDGVQFVGRVAPRDLPEVLHAAAVAVVPSKSPETFGLSAAEAMAHGLPVLACAVGNLPALVQDGGLIIPPGDVRSLARGLADLAASPDVRARLGQAGRARIAAEFTHAHGARHVIEAYEAVAEAARQSSGGLRVVA